MKDRYFDTIEQEQKYYAKKKLRRNNIIALIIIIPVIALVLYLRFMKSKDKFINFFYAIKSGEIFNPEYLAMLGIIAVIAAVICLIFRKKETNKSKLISGAVTAAAGITMIGMMIIICVKAI